MFLPPLKMDLNPHLSKNILKAFTKPFGVWDYNVNVPVFVAVTIGWMAAAVVLGLVNFVPITVVGLQSVQGPSGLFAPM